MVRHCLHLLEQPGQFLLPAAADAHPRVRLEALSAGSWLGGRHGAEITLTVASHPTDRWIRNALNHAMLTLGDEARRLVDSGSFDGNRVIDDIDKLFARSLPGAAKPKTIAGLESACQSG